MNNIIEIFKKARRLLSTGWCQGELSRDANNNPCEPYENCATQWCALGALSAVADTSDFNFSRLAGELVNHLGVDIFGISDWNDNPRRTQSEVLEEFDNLIEKLKTYEDYRNIPESA